MSTQTKDEYKRIIPRIDDGLKESQRKILCEALKKFQDHSNFNDKVTQFGTYIGQTNYHLSQENVLSVIGIPSWVVDRQSKVLRVQSDILLSDHERNNSLSKEVIPRYDKKK